MEFSLLALLMLQVSYQDTEKHKAGHKSTHLKHISLC